MAKKLSLPTAVAGSMFAVFALTGCGVLGAQSICRGGEYPIAAVGSTGSACQPDGQEPPEGFVRYPEGKVPEKVDDQWYRYWQENVLSEDGKESAAPETEN